jgi:hypothetical protein
MFNRELNYKLPPPDTSTIQQLNQTQSIDTTNKILLTLTLIFT